MCHHIEIQMACGHMRRSGLVHCRTAVEATLRHQQLGQDGSDVECRVPDVVQIGLVSCCEEGFTHLHSVIASQLCQVCRPMTAESVNREILSMQNRGIALDVANEHADAAQAVSPVQDGPDTVAHYWVWRSTL